MSELEDYLTSFDPWNDEVALIEASIRFFRQLVTIPGLDTKMDIRKYQVGKDCYLVHNEGGSFYYAYDAITLETIDWGMLDSVVDRMRERGYEGFTYLTRETFEARKAAHG